MQGKLVGAGRALADGLDCSYVCDVAVLPSHQGTGVGKQIVATLVRLSQGHRKIILYAVPGKEAFYRKFGFRRMLTAMAIFPDAGRSDRDRLRDQRRAISGRRPGVARPARPADRHAEREAAFVGVGHHVERALMGAGHLGGDVQAKTQAFRVALVRSPRERLEQTPGGLLRAIGSP